LRFEVPGHSSMSRAAFLKIIYDTLYRTYGPQFWWPADTPFEVTLGAILTQNTNWTNVEKAMASLRKACELTPKGILSLTPERLEEAIRSSGYYRQKAARLRVFCRFLMDNYGGELSRMGGYDTRKLREELLSLNGIGPETADSILLYALDKPIFVVDAYTIRLFSRLGLCTEKTKYYEVQSLFMDHLQPDVQLFNEYHGLIVKHGKERCRTKVPFCGECTLQDLCSYGSMGVWE